MHHTIAGRNAFLHGFKYTIGMRISYFCRYFIPNSYNVSIIFWCSQIITEACIVFMCLLLVINIVLKEASTSSLCNLNINIAVCNILI